MNSKEKHRRLRKTTKKIYDESEDDEIFEETFEPMQKWNIDEKVRSIENCRADFLIVLTAEELNVNFLRKTGFSRPIIVKDKRGLGLQVPTEKFTVDHVRICVGSKRLIDVMDVQTQKSFQMSMKSWSEYFNEPQEKRTKLLNVISLEFSHTKLENYVQSPEIVRQIDWISNVWPERSFELQAESQTSSKPKTLFYPKTRKYVLMSVARSYTDFHIDMGGSSVWYHVVKGRKIFWILPSSPSLLRLYEEWVLSGEQNQCFFVDLCEKSECQTVIVEAGSTFFLPSGWIHAVYTMEDSLVFGGNFLNSFQIPMQIEVWKIEKKIRVPERFRFPLFIETMWYVVAHYVDRWTKFEDPFLFGKGKETEKDDERPDLNACRTTTIHLAAESNKQNIEHSHSQLTHFEIEGLKTLCTFLRKSKDKFIPKDLKQSTELLNTMERLLSEQTSEQSQLNVSGQSIIQYTSGSHQNESTLKRKNSPMQSSPYSHPSSNVVTLHPSSTVLLSGPLANPSYYPSSNYPNNYNQYPSNPGVVYQNEKTVTAKDRHKRVRCKQCEPCCRDDCSECVHCKDMPKFGGVGKMKQCCLTKQCIAPILPSTASCQVCLKKKGSRKLSQLKPDEILYECERCMEIHHLPCFHNAHNDLSANEGVFSDDIPETWLCPKCINANTPEPPLYKLRPIVRRTLVTTNKGKNGLIEIPYNEPTVQQFVPAPSHIYPNEMVNFHPIYGTMINPTHSNEFHPEIYNDHYETMENESKKRCFYPNVYQNHGNHFDPSQISNEHPAGLNNPHGGFDDLSQSLNDSDLYIPQMFAV